MSDRRRFKRLRGRRFDDLPGLPVAPVCAFAGLDTTAICTDRSAGSGHVSPTSMDAPSPSYRCRSDPQMLLEVTRTIASVSYSMVGDGIHTDVSPAM